MDIVDEYEFLEEDCRGSDSQDQLLRRVSFVGDIVQSEDEEHQSAVAGEGTVESTNIVTVTFPDSRDVAKGENKPNDFFHTLPEESAVWEPNREMKSDMAFEDGVLNRSADWDTEMVDVGKIDVLGRELRMKYGLGDLSNNTVRILEHNLDPTVICNASVAADYKGKAKADVGCGFGPQTAVQVFEQCLKGTNSNNLENVSGESSDKEVFNSVENLGATGVRQNVGTSSEVEKLKEFEAEKGHESEAMAEADVIGRKRKQNESADKESIENFERAVMAGHFQNWDSLPMPVQECIENIAKSLNSTKDRCGQHEGKASSILHLLKSIQKYSDEDDDLENVSLLDILRTRGVTFPQPRWWPDTALFNKSRVVLTQKKK